MGKYGVCLACSDILNIWKAYEQGTDHVLLVCSCGKSMYDLSVGKETGLLWLETSDEKSKSLSNLCTIVKHCHLKHYKTKESEVKQLQEKVGIE